MINLNYETCCGCSACVHSCPKQAISMKEDKEGFLSPVVDASKCIECGICRKVCPMENPPLHAQASECYAAINKDFESRFKSSSGAIFPLLAEKVIQEGGYV